MKLEEHICQSILNKDRIKIEKHSDRWMLKEVSYGHDCWGRSEDTSHYFGRISFCPYCGEEL